MNTIYQVKAGQVLTVVGTVHVRQVEDATVGAVVTTSTTFGPYLRDKHFRIVGDATASVADASDTHYATSASVTAALAVTSALIIDGEGVPVDYTDGTPPATGEGTALPGTLYLDRTGGLVYRNSGTQAEPIWTALADVA